MFRLRASTSLSKASLSAMKSNIWGANRTVKRPLCNGATLAHGAKENRSRGRSHGRIRLLNTTKGAAQRRSGTFDEAVYFNSRGVFPPNLWIERNGSAAKSRTV